MKLPPASAPMGFLSDIHGNSVALEAVLAELGRRAIDRIFVAGDLLLGGPDPVGVYKRLMQVNAQCVRGVSDSALIKVDPSRVAPTDDAQAEMLERFRRTRAAIGELVFKYLERLPLTLRIPLIDGGEIVMVHGSPADPTEDMSADLSDDELMDLVAGDPAEIVICGGSHVPFTRALDDVRVVNVGSVGQAPEGNVAHFTIVTPRIDGTLVEQTWVEY